MNLWNTMIKNIRRVISTIKYFLTLIIIYTMIYKWKIVFISELQTVGQNNLQKKTVALEEVTDKEYKGWITFDLIKDKVDLIEFYNVGDTVNVSLNFRATESNGRWFTNINARKIEKVTDNSIVESSDDDLPF